MRNRNKLKARAKIAESKAERESAGVEYCPECGKVCCETRAEAERMARNIERRHKGHGISVYMCDACGMYHVTRAGYERSKLIRQNKLSNRGKLYD